MSREWETCVECASSGWPDSRPAVWVDDDGRGHCLFHSPVGRKYKFQNGEKQLTLDEFNDEVWRRLDSVHSLVTYKNKTSWANWMYAEFPAGTRFKITVFGANERIPAIRFSGAIFEGEVDFRDIIFSGATIFRGTTFGGLVSFKGAHINAPMDFLGCTAKNGALIFSNSSAESLENLIFSRSELSSFSFNNCTWPQRLGLEVHGQGSLTECEELYRAMKQRSATEHDQSMVSRWHYREKLMGIKRLLGEKSCEAQALLESVEDDTATLRQRFTSWRRLFATIPWRVRRSVLFWYWTLSGFGERPRRAGWSLFALAALALPLFLALKLVETYPWQLPLQPDFAAILAAVGEWLRCMPLVKLEFKPDPDLPFIGPVRFILNWAFQTLITLQAALFGFALRNQYRR